MSSAVGWVAVVGPVVLVVSLLLARARRRRRTVYVAIGRRVAGLRRGEVRGSRRWDPPAGHRRAA